MKRTSVDWYARQIVTEMSKCTDVEEIDVQMKLSAVKPLYASWLIELYNYVTSSAGRDVSMKGWEKIGIYNAIVKGINGLPSLNPFKDIDPLFENENLMNVIIYDESILDERQHCLEKHEADNQPE